MKRPCLGDNCGVLIESGSYCRRCSSARERTTPGRSSSGQARFRAAVLARAGGRCEVVVDGVRCTTTLGVQAHHVVPKREGGRDDLANGVALCRRHHALVEAAARRAQLSSGPRRLAS